MTDPILDCSGTNEITMYNAVFTELVNPRFSLNYAVGTNLLDSAMQDYAGNASRTWTAQFGPVGYHEKYHIEQIHDSVVKLAGAPITYDSGGVASTVKVLVTQFSFAFQEFSGTRYLGCNMQLVEVV
jgi:hypothetical protein